MPLSDVVIRGKTNEPPKIAVYGQEGIGKTTLATSVKNAIVLQTEEGCNQIDCAKFPLAETLEEMMGYVLQLVNEEHEFGAVVLDSATHTDRLIADYLCRQQGVKTIEQVDGGYGKGGAAMAREWERILPVFDSLRRKKNMTVILIAHSQVERFNDPDGPAYDRYSLRLNKNTSALITEWVDVIAYCGIRKRIATEDAGFNRKRSTAHAIGRDGEERILRCTGSPSCVAKNRYGITEDLPLSWQSFEEALTKGMQ